MQDIANKRLFYIMKQFCMSFTAFLISPFSFENGEKLTQHDIAISQKTRVLKLKHFHAIFSINKAEKCYALFFGKGEV